MQSTAGIASPVRDLNLHSSGAQSPNRSAFLAEQQGAFNDALDGTHHSSTELDQLRVAHKETLRAIELQVIAYRNITPPKKGTRNKGGYCLLPCLYIL
jgi:hypothetical protein